MPRTHAVKGRSAVGVEVDDLVDRVHAGVGAAGADRRDAMTGDLSECGLECVLDRAPIRLGLPAIEAGAVVLDAERDAHGGRPNRPDAAGVAPAAISLRSA